MVSDVAGARDDRREFWAGIAAFAGWCLAAAAGVPLLLGMFPALSAARWLLVSITATGVALVVTGELSRWMALPRR